MSLKPKMDSDVPVVQAMKEYLRTKRITQKELAKYLDISQQYLSDILNYKRNVSEAVAFKMGYQKVLNWVRIK